MRRAFIFNHWNQFDLFIILMSAVDIYIESQFGLSEINFQMINIVRVFKMFRLTRALRLVKVCHFLLCNQNFYLLFIFCHFHIV